MTSPRSAPRDAGAGTDLRANVTAAIIAAAGVVFAAYPIIRPYEDETTMAGAEAVASGRWIASHTLAMISFGLLAWGLIRIAAHLRGSGPARERASRLAATAMVLGTALVLPYYGAETFGLRALADEAIRTGDLAVLEAFDTVRYDPVAASTFLLGLILIGAAGVWGARALIALSGETAPPADRWGALAFGAGWVLLLPQFFAPPALRIGHGVLVLIGCILAAVILRRNLDENP